MSYAKLHLQILAKTEKNIKTYSSFIGFHNISELLDFNNNKALQIALLRRKQIKGDVYG